MVEVILSKKIADFSADSTTGRFKLSGYKGKYVVLFFYPRDLTPGCTQENLDFSNLKKEFGLLNAEVFGISRDTLESHNKFISKHNFKIQLLADPTEKICNKFQVLKEKNMYGKKVIGIERSTFIIDPAGKLIKEWRKVKVANHAMEVLTFLKEIN